MKKTFKFLFIFFITEFSFGQTEVKIDDNFPLSLLTRYFENLNHGSDLFEKFPVLKTRQLHSIIGCIYLLNTKENEIKNVAISRLKGISTQLFNEGKPTLLTYGMDSAGFAIEKNKTLNDDNHIIYLSIADCIVSESESKARIVFNEQTMKLISQKKGG